MKARVKATGEVLKVIDVDSERVLVKYGSDAKSLRVHEVDLIPDPHVFNNEIDWEQRRYELAKEAMGAFIASPSYQFQSDCNYYESQVYATADVVARDAVDYADALISKLRETPPKDEFSSIVEQAPSLHKALEEIVSLPIPEPMTWKAFSDRVRNIALSAIGRCK